MTHLLSTRRVLCLGAASLLSASFAFAEDDHDHDSGVMASMVEELFLGQQPEVQEQGEWQVTLRGDHFGERDKQTTTFSVEVEYGVTDDFTVGIEAPYVFLNTSENDADGLGDMEVALQHSLYRDDQTLATASLEIGFATGEADEELGEGKTELEPTLLVAREYGQAQYYFGIGGEFANGEKGTLTYQVAAAHQCGVVTPILELTGSVSEIKSKAYVTPGLSFECEKTDIVWMVGVPIGLTNDSSDWGVVLQAMFEF